MQIRSALPQSRYDAHGGDVISRRAAHPPAQANSCIRVRRAMSARCLRFGHSGRPSTVYGDASELPDVVFVSGRPSASPPPPGDPPRFVRSSCLAIESGYTISPITKDEARRDGGYVAHGAAAGLVYRLRPFLHGRRRAIRERDPLADGDCTLRSPSRFPAFFDLVKRRRQQSATASSHRYDGQRAL